MDIHRQRTWVLLGVIVFLSAVFFVADLVLPSAYAIWLLYIFPQILSYWLPRRKIFILIPICLTTFNLIASYWNPHNIPYAAEVFNRALGIAIVWITETLLILRKQVDARLHNTIRDLDASNQELTALSQEKDRVMGALAHDIRNPLSVIEIYGAMLLRKADPILQQIGEVLMRRSKYTLALVNNLLNAQAIASGTVSLDLQEADIADLVRSCLDNFSAIAAAKDLHLRMEQQGEDFRLRTDPIRLEEVINNLVSNAIHYSHSGGEILVRVNALPAEFRLEVIDQGLGIKPEEQDRLFKPFSKTSNRTTGGELSSGLGLYIVKRIIECFGGEIQVQSAPGQGTRFSVTLPKSSPL